MCMVPVVTVFLLLIIVLGTFTCYIYSTEKAIQPTTDTRKRTKNDDGNARKKRREYTKVWI